MAEILGADTSAEGAFQNFSYETSTNAQIRINNISIANQNQHIDEINSAIDKLKDSINNHSHINNTVETLKGYVAEEWHAETFNIDAIKDHSDNRAWTLHSNSDASVDIKTNFDKDYGLKYWKNAADTENQQAALSKNSSIPKYEHQERLVASDQLEEAKRIARERVEKNKINRPHVANAHYDTEKHLVDRIDDNEGHQSKELSIKESRQIAKEAKEGKFDPKKHGVEKSEHIPFEEEIQVDYLNKAMKAGLTAAAITAITQLVPEFYKAIDYLIKNGEIDVQQLKNSGVKIMSASAESFLRGSIAYGVELAIQEGLLGAAMKAVPPTVVGAMVTIVMGTIKSSILVAAGKMTPREMGVKFIDTVVISTGYLAAMKIGGIIGQALAPNLPVIGYAIGSLIGCSVAVVYNIGKKKLISFCVDTGFTCFGLVDQSYELPESVLDELGIGTANISRAEIGRSQVSTTGSVGNVDRTNYETVQMTMVKRGIIGVNKVGYVV